MEIMRFVSSNKQYIQCLKFVLKLFLNFLNIFENFIAAKLIWVFDDVLLDKTAS